MQTTMILAERDVFTILKDAESDRRNGCGMTDVDALREALTEARATIRELDSEDMKTLRRNLERADIKIARLEDEAAEAEDERDSERERANDLDDKLSDAESKIEELEARVKELEE